MIIGHLFVNLSDKLFSGEYRELHSAIDCAAKFSEKFGANIYLIGGIVRDLILDNPVKDIDITVEGDAVSFSRALETENKCNIISVQDDLKTAKVRFLNGIEVDFASTRQEKYSKSGFLPQAYNFGCSLKKDVLRRDFTINTLALRLNGVDKYKLFDYFNGVEDIKSRKIRVLHPLSFIEDPSRIIRALKFKKRFDFDYEENTQALMTDALNYLNTDFPLERIKGEFIQYFSIDKPNLYSEFINSGAYKLFCSNPVKNLDEDLFDDLNKFNLCTKSDMWLVFMNLLLLNSELIPEKLNLTSKEKKAVFDLKELAGLKNQFKDNYSIYKTFCSKADTSIFAYYLMTQEKAVLKFLEDLKNIKVLITGQDLISLGLTPSSYFNELFDSVLKEKLNGRLTNKEDELNFVKDIIKNPL